MGHAPMRNASLSSLHDGDYHYDFSDAMCMRVTLHAKPASKVQLRPPRALGAQSPMCDFRTRIDGRGTFYLGDTVHVGSRRAGPGVRGRQGRAGGLVARRVSDMIV